MAADDNVVISSLAFDVNIIGSTFHVNFLQGLALHVNLMSNLIWFPEDVTQLKLLSAANFWLKLR